MGTLAGMVSHVRVDYESGEHIVVGWLGLVLDHSQDVETRENGVSELDVVVEVAVDSVDASDRVRCCDYRATGLKLRDDARL